VSAPPTEEINVGVELRKFEKSPEVLHFLQKTLAAYFIFQEVKGQDAIALAHAFEEMNQPAGHVIMKQGDDGDNFYCLRSGTVDIFVTPKDGGDPILVLTLEGSGYFGELALMYHCPRAATVVCRTACVLEALDGTSFHTVLRRSGQNRRVTYHNFLREVPLLQSLRPDEVGKLADVLVQHDFKHGEYIITQGDEDAQTFYILYEGKATAILDQESGPSMQVKSYARGDYFGERALIQNHPRAANVVADGACTCVSIDRASFVRLLGSHEDSIERMRSTQYASTGQVVDKPPAQQPAVSADNDHSLNGRPDPGTTPPTAGAANDKGWKGGGKEAEAGRSESAQLAALSTSGGGPVAVSNQQGDLKSVDGAVDPAGKSSCCCIS